MIELTPEQKKEALKARIDKFKEGVDKLQQETGISFKPQITADGPINVFVDTRHENKTTS